MLAMLTLIAQHDAFTWNDLLHTLSLRDYNTRIVVFGVAALGAAAGLVGSFLLLRKRSLTGDALSHATLPGVVLAFLLMVRLGGEGKWLPGLLAGAAVLGLMGVGCVLAISRLTRLKDDAALGIVLSVFFGMGVSLLALVQNMPAAGAAGLESFIYGKTAAMVRSDLVLIGVVSTLAVLLCIVFYKEMKLLCFDEDFAGAQGWPVLMLDILMLALVTAVTVIGLQAVGLILIIALLIIPAAAARFWTERLTLMMVGAAVIGAVSGGVGAMLSALPMDLPAGAVIVVVAAAAFGFSMIFGPRRGVLGRWLSYARLVRTVGRQHLLRALYERLEGEAARRHTTVRQVAAEPQPYDELLATRTWSALRLNRVLATARRDGLITRGVDGEVRLTAEGLSEAARVVRNHRLWEMYLITHAEIAPSHVDRDADMIEHVLGPQMVEKLERLLKQRGGGAVPASPHEL